VGLNAPLVSCAKVMRKRWKDMKTCVKKREKK
jgi:hypothetical protein